MRRVRASGSLAAVAVALLVAAAFPRVAVAQMDDRPFGSALRGSVDDPVLRRRPPRGPAPRPGAPQYGNPPGSGAGSTGYVSTNPHRARAARPPAPASSTGNGNRVARPGSANTGPSRVGVPNDVPAGTATPLVRRPRAPDEEPFDPIGIRVGSFIFKPAVETTGGFDSNPNRVTGGGSSRFLTVAPELQVRSAWSQHALNADIRGAYTWYDALPSLDRPFLDARVNGRIDIRRDTRADFELRTNLSTTNPGSPDLPADLARLPVYTAVGGTVGLVHQFNRLEVGLKGSIDRVTYENSVLTDGSVVSNRDRDYNEYGVQLRAAYELTPGMKPFAELALDTRVRDLKFDAFGEQRDSDGIAGRVGTTFEFSRKLTGSVSIGYLTRTYKDPTLPDLKGLTIDGSLIWTATPLTTFKLTAKSTADETILAGVSGILRRDIGVQVDHAFRRWLIGTARFGYGTDLYDGSTREDQRYVAALALTYKLNRNMHLKAELRQEWRRSNEPGNNYDATIGLIGLRLMR